MPKTEVVFYCEENGKAPLIDWLAGMQQAEARNRCLAKLSLLEEQGHELRRPHAENIGNGLYELRVKFVRVHFRMLYFFHGRDTTVVSHGFPKEGKIPPGEIKLALARKQKFENNPKRHTYHPEE